MRTRALVPLVVAGGLGLFPAAASASVLCVGTSGGDCADTFATTNLAVLDAQEGDTIRFGAGTFGPVDTNLVLNYVGVGAGTPDSDAGATVIQQTTVGDPGMHLPNGGTVRALRAVGGPGSGSPGASAGGTGIEFSPTTAGDRTLELTDVIAVGGPAPPGQNAGAGFASGGSMTAGTKVATVNGGALLGGSGNGGLGVYTCCLRTDLIGTLIRSPAGVGLYSSIGATTNVERSTIEGVTAIQTQAPDSLVLSRSRINGTFTGLLIRPDSMTPTPNVSVRNSLVTSGPTGLAAVEFAMDMGAPAVFSAVGSTFIGRGNSQAALYAHRNTDGSPALTATLRNSIARVEGTGSDLWADRASFDIASSSFTTRKLENGGTAPDPGAGSNVSGDPMLAPDFSLVPSSPLIDRGDPSVALAGELDLAGAARSLDGNGDCVLAPDIGAFERPDLCPPNAAPSLTKVRAVPSVFAPVAKRARARATARKVKRGTRFRYTLSEAARVRITIERRVVRKVGKRKRVRFRKVTVLSAAKQAGRQSTRFTGRVRGKALKPGRYRARLVAIDALGARSGERRLKLRIVRP